MDSCPVCDDPAECRGYPHLWRRLAEGRALWEPVHAIINGMASSIFEPPGVPAPAPVPLASSLRAVALGYRRCLYSTHEGCGCTGTHCYRFGRVVGLADCIDCLESK